MIFSDEEQRLIMAGLAERIRYLLGLGDATGHPVSDEIARFRALYEKMDALYRSAEGGKAVACD